MTRRCWTSIPQFPPITESKSTQPQVKRLLTLPSKDLLLNPDRMRELFQSLRDREIDAIEVTWYNQPIARLNRAQPRDTYEVQVSFCHQGYRISSAARAIARSGHERGLLYGPRWAIELVPILKATRIRMVVE